VTFTRSPFRTCGRFLTSSPTLNRISSPSGRRSVTMRVCRLMDCTVAVAEIALLLLRELGPSRRGATATGGGGAGAGLCFAHAVSDNPQATTIPSPRRPRMSPPLPRRRFAVLLTRRQADGNIGPSAAAGEARDRVAVPAANEVARARPGEP